MEASNTRADLRGIHNAGGGVAWASGTGGTVLRTIDDGAHWQRCAIPDAATDGATLDFRGVQAWDDRSAIVMSSGSGEKSRLYETVDGCKSWKLMLKNPDKDGFWDAIYFENRASGWLIGDPVGGTFTLFRTDDAGRHWSRRNTGLRADAATEGAFAASNSSLIAFDGFVVFGSGGTGGARVYSVNFDGNRSKSQQEKIALGGNTASSGIFSIGARAGSGGGSAGRVFIVVGGDYKSPSHSQNTCAFKLSGDRPWTASASPPPGFRSSVQWSEPLKAWITVGPNGTDMSVDDGRSWRPLRPTAGELPDADKNWNALSLPFVVGPSGRIGKLRQGALKP